MIVVFEAGKKPEKKKKAEGGELTGLQPTLTRTPQGHKRLVEMTHQHSKTQAGKKKRRKKAESAEEAA